jgi:hypothetical protein
VDAGRTISDEEAKSILIKPGTSSGLLAGTDPSGERNWRRWHRERLAQMPLVDLERAVSSEIMLDRTARFVWAGRQFSEEGPKLRRCIDDRYETEVEAEIGVLQSKIGIDKETIVNIRSLRDSIRQDRTREGLDIICLHGGMAELPYIRRALASGFVRLSNLELMFLRKYGSWEDIHAIIAASQNSNHIGLAFFSSRYETVREIDIATTIYGLANGRLQELCGINAPDRILALILSLSSVRDIRELDDRLIRKLIHSDTYILRIIVVLRSVATLPKARLRRLLSDYVADYPHFYDVVHLLDFGITISKEKGTAAAKRALTRELRRWF